MAKFARASQLIRLFKQSAAPTVAQGLNLDDLWVDTDDHATYVCTSVSPVVMTAIGGGGTPGGSDTQVQFNDGGSFGGDAGMVFNKTTNDLTITGAFSASNVSGTNTGDVTDATITTTDVTTNNASASKHGWCPKLPNNTTTFLRGDGSFAAATGGWVSPTPSTVAFWYNEFFASSATVGGFATNNSGTGSGVNQDNSLPDGTHWGVWKTETGTATSGWAAISLDNGGFVMGTAAGGQLTFETCIKTPAALSDATDNYTLNIGFCDGLTGVAASNDFLGFIYTHGTNSGAWTGKAKKTSGGTSTTSDTTTAVAANTWVRLKFVVNSDATSVTFYVNDVALTSGALTTNIPSVNAACFGWAHSIVKSAGTTSRILYTDYVLIEKQFSTPS